MIKEHRRIFKIFRLMADLVLVTLCYYAIYEGILRLANPFGLVLTAPDYKLRLPLILDLCWAAALLASGLYEKSTRRIGFGEVLGGGARVLLLMLVLFALGLFAFKIQFLSRKFMALYSLACWLLLSLSMGLAYRALGLLRRMGFNTVSVLLVGEGEDLLKIWRQFEQHKEWGYRVIGFLSTGGTALRGGPRRLGTVAKLDAVLRKRIVDQIIMAAPLKRAELMAEATEKAAAHGINVRILMDEASKSIQFQVDPVGSILTLAISAGGSSPYLRMLKVAFDYAATLALALLLFVPCLLVALFILLTMGRPVFFLQKRAGRNGRAFFLYKFRTMIVGAREVQEKLAAKNQMSGPVFKVANDPRVTRLGRFLRRYSVDELPQLLNVLRGELSLVGPRPLAMYEARNVPAWAWRRYSVKPGITCLWQVMGRNHIDFDDWMKLDLQYVDEWSLGLDFKILLQTLPAILSSKGAY